MTDIKMLPLPEWTGRYKVPTEPMSGEGEMLDDLLHRYGHAVAEHNVASRDAEIERLKVVAHGFVDEIAAKDAEIERLRAEVSQEQDYAASAARRVLMAQLAQRRAEARAERLAEALRGLMLNSPGGHSCEEFHHYKSDRHMPGDDCPVQLRWNKAVTTAQSALRDHDQEAHNG